MIQLYGLTGLRRKSDATLLLSRAAAKTWGLQTLPEVVRRSTGKPFFRKQPELHFNLSHSGSLALCALSDAPVGVDIEVLRPRREGLAQRILSPEELAWYQNHGEDPAVLLTLWTRKEALCKKNGTGLTFPVRDIQPPLPGSPWGEPAITSFRGEDWVASVCGSGPLPASIQWWSVETLEGGMIP